MEKEELILQMLPIQLTAASDLSHPAKILPFLEEILTCFHVKRSQPTKLLILFYQATLVDE